MLYHLSYRPAIAASDDASCPVYQTRGTLQYQYFRLL